MPVPRLLVAVSAAIIASVASVSPATAQTPSTMDGETLVALFSKCNADPLTPPPADAACVTEPAPPVVEATCDEDGTSTLRYDVTASGTQQQGSFAIAAAGPPYPGSFTEQGTVTIGPQDQDPVPVGGGLFPPVLTSSMGFDAGPLLTWTANFRIESGDTVVLGRKTLTGSGYGVCTSLDNEPRPEGGESVTGYFGIADATLSYNAVIITPEAVYRDSGTAQSDLRESFARFPAGDGAFDGVNADVGLLVEVFSSDGTAPTPVDADMCKKDGWFGLGIFTNQGDCVSFFSTQGMNEPGQNVPG